MCIIRQNFIVALNMKEFIKKHKALSWVLGILGTLIIGGLGSGVWEILLKPALSFLSNGVINFLVDTSASFSNEIYQIFLCEVWIDFKLKHIV